MANFSSGRQINLTASGTIVSSLQDQLYLLAHPNNSGNITITAGDNDLTIWILQPGASFEFSRDVAKLNTIFGQDVPLKAVVGTGDSLVGFVG